MISLHPAIRSILVTSVLTWAAGLSTVLLVHWLIWSVAP